MGRPEGGPRDETPPRFTGSNPMPGAKNVTRNRIVAHFDENIQIEDAFSKVVVSPAQIQPPAVTANGRRLTVELRDSLRPNTTYTIDFADAIKDLNEGNILDGFALDFSTGDVIDTLRISGMVLQAENLEPAQGMLVGLYSNLSDTAIHTLPFERIARTNQYGQFTIRNLPAGEYRVYAVNDLNRDYHWDRSEDVAFIDYTVSPSIEQITVADTLYSSTGGDSIVEHAGLKYLPNDVLLTWFNENYRPQYLKDYSRADRRRILFNFAAPSDTLPEISIVDGGGRTGTPGRRIDEWALLRHNPTRDSLEYWIADTAMLASADSLRLAVRYLRTDTTDNLAWTTDTLRFFFREHKPKEKKKKKGEETPLDSAALDSVYRANLTYLDFSPTGMASQEVYLPLMLEAAQPIASIDSAGVRLEMLVDTVWEAVPGIHLVPDSLNPLQRRIIRQKWVPGRKYRFTADSLAVTGIYGEWNRPVRHEFTVKNLEEYSNLIFRISGPDAPGQAVVELLNGSDEPVYRAAADSTGRVVFRYLNPGTYYARMFIDSNGNGKWDTGRLDASVQPEEVAYFPKKLQLKKNWDVEQAWNIYELAIDVQKPLAIKKNKPKLKRGETAPEEEDEYDEEDDPNSPNYNPNPFDRSPKRKGGNGRLRSQGNRSGLR